MADDHLSRTKLVRSLNSNQLCTHEKFYKKPRTSNRSSKKPEFYLFALFVNVCSQEVHYTPYVLL